MSMIAWLDPRFRLDLAPRPAARGERLRARRRQWQSWPNASRDALLSQKADAILIKIDRAGRDGGTLVRDRERAAGRSGGAESVADREQIKSHQNNDRLPNIP